MKIIARDIPPRAAWALEQAGVHPLLAQLFAARGVTHRDELDDGLARLLPPEGLQGAHDAAHLLADAIASGKRICIVADYDCDGATACAVAMRGLRLLGATHVTYLVPDRVVDGYGLTAPIAQRVHAQGADLLVTVDNGIASVEGVAQANALGLQVLVTDHHLPGPQLPQAAVIVNPNQPGCNFASKSLAGVGVVFYVMAALRSALRDEGWFAKAGIVEPNLAGLLDLVALGTVADVVTLDRNNRILVNEGLKRIRAGRACAGILALLEIGKRTLPALQASDLGFAAGPRLNAAGRLDDMALGIECLLADDPVVAMATARRLDEMNQQRKGIEEDMRDQAVSELDALDIGGATAPAGVCIYNPAWHQGVIGILAARIKERLHRPVIAFADADVDGEGEPQLKGSARSIAGLHIRDVLDTVATRNPGLISRFGGHAMAAGLSLRTRDYAQFCAAFAAEVTALLTEDDLQARILTDGEVRAEELTLNTAQLLRELGPWGQGFPEPSFDGEFEVLQQRMLGAKHLKLVLCPPGCRQQALDAIAFNVDPALWATCNVARISAVYRLDVNEYRGQRSLQLVLEHLAPSSDLATR